MPADTDLQFPVLIGDIGGTNARFQIIEEPLHQPLVFDPVRTADFANIEQALECAVTKKNWPAPAFGDHGRSRPHHS